MPLAEQSTTRSLRGYDALFLYATTPFLLAALLVGVAGHGLTPRLARIAVGARAASTPAVAPP